MYKCYKYCIIFDMVRYGRLFICSFFHFFFRVNGDSLRENWNGDDNRWNPRNANQLRNLIQIDVNWSWKCKAIWQYESVARVFYSMTAFRFAWVCTYRWCTQLAETLCRHSLRMNRIAFEIVRAHEGDGDTEQYISKYVAFISRSMSPKWK